MPELPEVETFKKYFDRTTLNKRILSIEEVDSFLLEDDQDVQAFTRSLKEKIFTGSGRHGKYLLLELQGPKYLILHFGMTGFLKSLENSHHIPDHTRLLLRLDNSYLAFVNARRLGKIFLCDDISLFLQKKKLGPDALSIDKTEFIGRVSKRKKPIKSALMDQSMIAGIGNLYADEILFQTSVHPLSLCTTLERESYNRMFKKTKYVLNTAIAKHAKIGKYPETWLLPHRTKEDCCPLCKGKMEVIKIAGRTTYFCSERQKI